MSQLPLTARRTIIREAIREASTERRADVFAGLDRMLAIAELARTVDDFRPLGDTVELICDRVVLMTGCDFATVYLATEQDREEFSMWGSAGVRPEYLGWARSEPSDPKRSWAPVMLSSESGQPRMVSDIFQRPDLHRLWDAARIQGYRGLGVMPMVARGKVLGTLNIYWRQAHEHQPAEFALLQTAARLAGVAVETAIIAERQAAATNESLRLATELEAANRELHDLSQAQVELAEELAGSTRDPAEAICSFLAQRLGSSVMLCNPDGKPRTFAGPVEMRASMAALLARRDLGRRSREAVFQAGDCHVHRVGKEQVLGYLLISTASGAPGSAETVVLRHALALLAFELESERTDRSLRLIARPGILHALARGHLTEHIANETAPVVEMAGQPCRIVYLAGTDDSASLAAGRRLNRLPSNSDFLAAAAEAGGVMVLLQDGGSDSLRRMLAQVMDTVAPLCPPGGASLAFSSPAEVPAALEQAAAAARSSSAGRVTFFEDLGPTGELLGQVGGEGASAFVERMLGPLLESDARRGTALVTSLDAYLRHRGSLRDAAAELGVHPNTLQLRLTRSARLTGMDLHDPRQLGLLSIAISWRALLPAR